MTLPHVSDGPAPLAVRLSLSLLLKPTCPLEED